MTGRWVSACAWCLCLAAMLVGCRSEGASRTSWFKRTRPESVADRTPTKPASSPRAPEHRVDPSQPRVPAERAVAATDHPNRAPRGPVGEATSAEEPAEKVAASHVPAFSPSPLNPLSPAERIEPGPLGKGYQTRVDALRQVGQQLASATTSRDINFRFETTYNPKRAATYHTDAGHILLTSSMLERVETKHQLAAALALEMAEVIRESEIAAAATSLENAGLPATASVNGKTVHGSPSEIELDETATDLLKRAGFGSLNLADVKRDLGIIVAARTPTPSPSPNTPHVASKPSNPPAEPKWDGPRSSLAN